MFCPRAPSYINSRLLGYIEPRTLYSGNWSPRVKLSVGSLLLTGRGQGGEIDGKEEQDLGKAHDQVHVASLPRDVSQLRVLLHMSHSLNSFGGGG